ncbi:MAG: asparagine synthase (glutamine-hydrolyzing) [Gemmatimonadota bacterium]
MCGIAGYVLRRPALEAGLIEDMLGGVRHRGPDDEGVVLIDSREGRYFPAATDRTTSLIRERSEEARRAKRVHDVAFGHARYAVIDLSHAAHQPFISRSGRTVAVINGEIYNHLELRTELAKLGVHFRSASDTEALVEGYEIWGDDLWRRMNGFWAVLLHDAVAGRVVISRDRLGVAPLYMRETTAGIFFASEIRPLLELSPRTFEIEPDAVRGFIATGFRDYDEGTMFRAVRSLPPASVTTIDLQPECGGSLWGQAKPKRFWHFPEARLGPGEMSITEAAKGLRERLVGAVALRLRSDVPVALELSGGTDSSCIAAAVAELGRKPEAWTVVVTERNELPWAAAVAAHFGFPHRVLNDASEHTADGAASFARIMGEPWHSPNVQTSWMMRKAMKGEGVGVVISGSGGDEILGGYEHEFWDAARADLVRNGLRTHALAHSMAYRLASRERVVHSLRELIGAGRRLVGGGGDRKEETAVRSRAERLLDGYPGLDFGARVRFHCEIARLPYYLRNGDHLTMSLPLEHRFPYLDVDLVEFAATIPVDLLYANGWTKYALRKSMEDRLPAAVTWRRDKMGFPFPLERFLNASEGRLQTHTGLVVQRGYHPPVNYRQLVARDPHRLWRICATGFWLASVS